MSTLRSISCCKNRTPTDSSEQIVDRNTVMVMFWWSISWVWFEFEQKFTFSRAHGIDQIFFLLWRLWRFQITCRSFPFGVSPLMRTFYLWLGRLGWHVVLSVRPIKLSYFEKLWVSLPCIFLLAVYYCFNVHLSFRAYGTTFLVCMGCLSLHCTRNITSAPTTSADFYVQL